MSDFEKDFMSQVQNDGSAESSAVPSATDKPKKKPIDKRWFVLGGLILLYVVVLIMMYLTEASADKNVGRVESSHSGIAYQQIVMGVK